ncbi:sugar phosphate nucleotidyltransferase [Paenibacillus sp. YYML68]|uniref:sugar phosphate nucleotidyltransferase n=1 Tax=Paenibacillus sp. YYML68 TaxID=2909250 RepID=UPI0024930C8F|nr:sugar phosphate nucleotidyltransferase [Paenibacillus sp. YYML68]
MKLILLSGGSGKRLWPLSNDARSKQFLKVLDNETGDKESMVQRVWRQLEHVGLAQDACVTTGKGQVEMIVSQLGSLVPVVVEPARRDTFPAIALAATYLYSILGVSLQEVIAVLPVDPYVEDDFFLRVKELETIVEQSDADLALIGIKPTYPSEKYGYIVPKLEEADASSTYVRVSHFKEKPREEEAKSLLEANALWNGGVFAFKLDYIINLLMAKGLPIQYEELLKQFDSLPKISFDYEVVEKASNIVATPYEGYWKDLGTWNTLTEEMGVSIMGSGILCEQSTNSHIVNELDIPVTVLGVPNVVVAVSPDGILVSDKAASPRLKDMINHIEQRPMYEERRWGEYKVMDYHKLGEGQELLTRKMRVTAGNSLSYHMHRNRSECWTIVAGHGEFILNNVFMQVKEGDMLQIPAGTLHSIRALTDLEWIEVQMGKQVNDGDIVRLFMNWEEIELHCRSVR